MLTIRRYTADMADKLRPIADASLCGEDVLLRIGRGGFSLGYVPLTRAEWRSFPPPKSVEPAALLGDESAAMFVAFEEDVFIGSAAIRITETGWAELLDIRVDAAHRRLSVARALLDACERFSADRGMAGLRCTATDTNPAACQFLEHCGFTLQGVDRMALIHTPAERDKPLARRACAITFYRHHQKG